MITFIAHCWTKKSFKVKAKNSKEAWNKAFQKVGIELTNIIAIEK